MRRLPLSLAIAIAVASILPLAGQTPGDQIAKLRARIQELEAENDKLKKAVVASQLGSLGVPHGQIVVIDGAYVTRDDVSKAGARFLVTSINGQKPPREDISLDVKTVEWARSEGTAGKWARKLKGYQCRMPAGDPYGRTQLAFHLPEVFMALEVLEER